MVNAIRQSARLSMKSRHISDNCAKATPSVSAPYVLCRTVNAQYVLHISLNVICVFLSRMKYCFFKVNLRSQATYPVPFEIFCAPLLLV